MSLFLVATCLSISCVFLNLILKAFIVGISRPSLHVYIKNLPNSNIWLSVFQLLSFIGLKPRQVSFVRFTFWLVLGLTNFSTHSRKIEYSNIPKKGVCDSLFQHCIEYIFLYWTCLF